MARTFHRRRTAQPIAELNLTNLIDLGFTLLIIFMIATPLIHQQSIKVNLPEETPRPQDQSERPRVETITFTSDGQLFWNDLPLTLAEMESLLSAAAQDPDPPVITINGDQDATYGEFMAVLDRLKEHELLKVDFSTRARGR